MATHSRRPVWGSYFPGASCPFGVFELPGLGCWQGKLSNCSLHSGGVGWDLPWAPLARLLQLQPAQPVRGSRAGRTPRTDYHCLAEGLPGTVALGPSPGGRAECPGTDAWSSVRALPPAPAGLRQPSQAPWSPPGLPHDPRECATCVPGHLPATPMAHAAWACLHTPISPPSQWSGTKEPEDAEAGRPGQRLGWGEQMPGGGPCELLSASQGLNVVSTC